MKYMLMMNVPGGPYQIGRWPEKDLKAHIAYMVNLNKKLGESGELVAAEGLAGPDQAKRVRAGKDGKPITDGVFPESKEFLAGYWIVDVDTPERAYEIAAEASADQHRGTQLPADARGAAGRGREVGWGAVLRRRPYGRRMPERSPRHGNSLVTKAAACARHPLSLWCSGSSPGCECLARGGGSHDAR